MSADGFKPWFDEEDILPGQDWDNAIRAAVRASHVVVVLLSPSSITKEGYVQKEIRFVLDVADEKPEGTIFVVPARLESCEVPQRLRSWQWVDLFEPRGYERLVAALRSRETQIYATATGVQGRAKAANDKEEVTSPGTTESAVASGDVKKRRAWSRGDKIGLGAAMIALLGLPGVYLAVPGVASYVHEKVLLVRNGGKGEHADEARQVAAQERTSSQKGGQNRPSQIFVRTSVFPVQLYLDGNEIATLTASAPSFTVDTNPGIHKVSVRSDVFRRETTINLLPESSPYVLLVDGDGASKRIGPDGKK